MAIGDQGWLRWNPQHSKCDAHCRLHESCKMDRKVKRSTIGLSMAWLAACRRPGGIEGHQLAKEIISAEGSYDERVVGRLALVTLAETDADTRAIIDMEAAAVGQFPVLEPQSIPCRSLLPSAGTE